MSEISPLKDHLSDLVGYSSPRSPEGGSLGAEGAGVGGGRCGETGKEDGLQILQV